MLPEAKPKKHETPAAPAAAEPAQLGSRGLLAWVPADALLVLRVPHVENLGELRRRTTIGALLQNPAVLMALQSPDQPLGQMLAKLHGEVPELEPLLALLPELKGELVLGLTRFELQAAKASHAAPEPAPTVALAFEAQSGAEELQAALDPLLEKLRKRPDSKWTPLAGSWGAAGETADFHVEIRRTGRVFSATLARGADLSGGIRPQGAGAARPGFAAAQVVASSADLNAHGQGVLEFYVNTVPVWDLVAKNAPQEAHDVLAQLGLLDVQGLSLALGLGKRGMAESHGWCSPAHKDIVSRVLASAPADRELARWIPEDASTAGLYAFDIAQLLACIEAVVPAAQQPEFDRGFEQLKQATGIDLRTDVFANLGPSLAMVSRGDPLAFMNGPSGLCLMIQAHDAERTRGLLERLVPLLPPNLRTHSAEIAGQTVQSLDTAPLGLPLAGVWWCQVDGALLLATDDKLLERCLQAGAKPGVKQPALAEALAGPDVIGASLSAAVGDLPQTLTLVRKTDTGLTVSAADGSASAGAGALMVIPIVSSIAIPKLMAARLEANEAAAEATMRAISGSEAQVLASGAIDVDKDGVPEYGFLGELSGTTTLRGTDERLEPSILSNKPPTGEDGIWTRSGYHFVVYLPTPKNGAISESKAKDGRDVSADAAETHFVAYAWPVHCCDTGNRVFVVDAEGDLICCENRDGKYSGLEHRPAFDAYWPAKNGPEREQGLPYVGRDGKTWKSTFQPPR
jgi:hypothetical protein